MADELNEKQRRFVAEYLVDLNATQAAIRAGYSEQTAHSQGPRLLDHVGVQAAITEAQKAREERTLITADRVLYELAIIAFSDIGDVVDGGNGASIAVRDLSGMAPRVRRAIESVSEKPIGDKGDKHLTVKMHSKIAALKQLADHLGLQAPQKHEHSGPAGGPIEMAQLPTEQLLAMLKETDREDDE